MDKEKLEEINPFYIFGLSKKTISCSIGGTINHLTGNMENSRTMEQHISPLYECFLKKRNKK